MPTDINVTIGSNPINVTLSGGTRNSVPADTKFRFDGAAGDTYFIYVSATATFQLWLDGTLVQEWSK